MKKRIISWVLMFAIVLGLLPQFVLNVNANEDGISGDLKGTIAQGALPSVGDSNVLVFYTTFPGGNPGMTESPEEVEEVFFGENNNSLRAYYQRSSYGKANINGDVYEYTTKYDSSYYDGIQADGTTYTSFAKLVDEILNYYRDTIDWQQYDANDDGYIDGIYIVARTSPSWESGGFVVGHSNQVDGVGVRQVCYLGSDLWINHIAHETCHMFGMGDMYANVGLNTNGIMTDCIMDSGDGDLPGITKYFLGWIDNPIIVSGEGTFDVTLNSYSTTGEILIIPPNGDLNNPNWMIVEYLTKEANNNNEGVRIWKSNIVTDPTSSVKYEYLETLHPEGVRNHYYQAGEMVSPYTYPSTSYGINYALNGAAKYMDELGYSGITIHINNTSNDAASITVVIDNRIDDISATAEMTIGFSASEFINDPNRILLATIYSPLELGKIEDVYLQSVDNDVVIPLEIWSTYSSKQINLYVSNENAPFVNEGEEYKINLQETLKTYYGHEVDIVNFDGTVRFDELPKPLISLGELSNGCKKYREFFYPEYFNIREGVVSYFSVENASLWLREIDISSNTITEKRIALNQRLTNDDNLNKVTILNDKYYLTFWGPETNQQEVSLIELYSLEGDLLGEYVMPQRGQLIRGESTNLTILMNNELYHVIYNQMQLKLEKIVDWRYLDKVWWDGEEWYGIGYEHSQSAEEENRVICNLKTGEGKYYIKNKSLMSEAIDVIRKDNRIFIITLHNDLNMYICDSNWNFVEEKVLLKDTGVDFVTKMDSGFQGESLWVKFDGYPPADLSWWSSSFLVTFDGDFQLKNYYSNGRADTHTTGNILSLSGDRFFLGLTSTYKILQEVVSCDLLGRDHKEVIDKAISATCEEDGLTEGSHCSVCAKILVAQKEIKALGHVWEVENTVSGIIKYVCTVCGGKKEEIDPSVQSAQFEDVKKDAYYAVPVHWAVVNNITNGYGSANTFCPDTICTRGQIVTFLWRAKGCPEPTSTVNPFTDIKENDYYYKAVLWAVENGITSGYGSSTIFNPDGACTRGQVATFLWRAEGHPGMSNAENPFIDVDAGTYYYDAVLWAVANGITNGYGGSTTFAPDVICNRGQIVTFLYRTME